MVSTRLKGDIEVCPPGIARRSQSLSLSMRTTKPTMKSAADDPPSAHNNSPYERVGRDALQPSQGKIKRLSH